jgi:hypothetical protein
MRQFCLRTYTVAPGKLQPLLDRFRDHAILIFAKHGLDSVGYWVDSENNTLVYLLVAESPEAYERGWAAFREDPEWAAVKESTERDGKFVLAHHARMLTPCEFSALR